MRPTLYVFFCCVHNSVTLALWWGKAGSFLAQEKVFGEEVATVPCGLAWEPANQRTTIRDIKVAKRLSVKAGNRHRQPVYCTFCCRTSLPVTRGLTKGRVVGGQMLMLRSVSHDMSCESHSVHRTAVLSLCIHETYDRLSAAVIFLWMYLLVLQDCFLGWSEVLVAMCICNALKVWAPFPLMFVGFQVFHWHWPGEPWNTVPCAWADEVVVYRYIF